MPACLIADKSGTQQVAANRSSRLASPADPGAQRHARQPRSRRAGHLHFPCPHPRWLLCPAGRPADLARAGADRRPDPGRPRRRHPLAFGFDDPHLWSFFLSGKPWDRTSEYALLADDPFGDPKQAALDLPISQAPTDKEFLFLFDYGDEWHFGVKLTGTGRPTRPGARYPDSSPPTATPHRSTQKWTRVDASTPARPATPPTAPRRVKSQADAQDRFQSRFHEQPKHHGPSAGRAARDRAAGLATTDLAAVLVPFRTSYGVGGTCAGVARLLEAERERQPTVWLDAGDFTVGPTYPLLGTRPWVDVGELPIDAAAAREPRVRRWSAGAAGGDPGAVLPAAVRQRRRRPAVLGAGRDRRRPPRRDRADPPARPSAEQGSPTGRRLGRAGGTARRRFALEGPGGW